MTAKQSECPFALPATTELGRGSEGGREEGASGEDRGRRGSDTVAV